MRIPLQRPRVYISFLVTNAVELFRTVFVQSPCGRNERQNTPLLLMLPRRAKRQCYSRVSDGRTAYARQTTASTTKPVGVSKFCSIVYENGRGIERQRTKSLAVLTTLCSNDYIIYTFPIIDLNEWRTPLYTYLVHKTIVATKSQLHSCNNNRSLSYLV